MRFSKKKMLVLMLSFCFLFWFLKSFLDSDKKRFSVYVPNVNYSNVMDTYTFQLSNGHFKIKEKRKLKTILLFTTHFYSEYWKDLSPEILHGYTKKAKCKIDDCIVTYDKKLISSVDVVMFHGVDFGHKNFTSEHFQAQSLKRPSYQRWLFWMHETPIYYPETENYNNIFNWTMSFTRQADIYHPYYSYKRLRQSDSNAKFNHAIGKTKKIAWMVSHCGMTRSDYVMELQKYTHVTVYGLCGASFDNMGGICSKVISECMEELSQYKFYLAFENSFCQDYVTEKYYRFGLMYGLVPIVMGANYDSVNSIPGSYINVNDFDSIEELGQYINYLDQNDKEYNKYFEWKQHFKVTDGIDKICLICHAAHNLNRKPHVYSDFNAFWSTRNLCDPYNVGVDKLHKQIESSKTSRQAKQD